MTELTDSGASIDALTHWFLLSVYRHLEAGDWTTPDQCPLAPEQLDELVASYLADRSARQSLITVLKNPDYHCRLLRFGPTRDHRQLQLSDSTIAFRRARSLLQSRVPVSAASGAGKSDAIESTASTASTANTDSTVPLAEPVPATASTRRAARRAQPALRGEQGGPAETHGKTHGKTDSGMSDEEYARLEQALAATPAAGKQEARRYRSHEDRLSLLSGLLAGALVFILVYWLFL